ncbi:DUF4179 domain-containing protein [Metabacillus idriensis]|uniref:DUF4179 domain-containing protein n=1 Tax=Metabacillus idriensis TaxID=324768 RepID=UPI001747EBEB|nr:DUF4179 domain-containing protein [Metabacillus idriensis]
MSDGTEKKLALLKEKMNSVVIPNELLDEAILKGYQKAKKRKRTPSIKWASIAAAVFIFTFITLIRVSPAFASYVSSIPGMEKMVEIIRFNKGLMSAVENGFAQEVGVSDEHNGIQITINSAIVDSKKLKLFYTVHNKADETKIEVEFPKLKSGDVNLNENASFTSGHIEEVLPKNKSSDWSMEYDFAEPMNYEEFQLEMTVKSTQSHSNTEENTFQFLFQLDQDLVAEKVKVIDMNQTVTIEDQKVTFKKIEIRPLSASLHVQYDAGNTMELFAFEDLKLVDEKGEPWSIYQNGLVGSEVSATEDIIYLESSYFEEPKELYLEFSKIRAMKKADLEVIVDPETNTVLKSPKDDEFGKIEVLENEVAFTYYDMRDNMSFLINGVKDANGVELSSSSSAEDTDSDTGEKRFAIQFERDKITKGPLSMTFIDYPRVIEKKTKVKIK